MVTRVDSVPQGREPGLVVGYYVHHAGAGHLTRATVVAARLRERGHEVVLLGSHLGAQPGITLDRDDLDGPWEDPTAGGALHWLPVRHDPTQSRMTALARWVEQRRPDVVVVDVSVEVTVLMRLLGVPTVVVAQPGVRDDAPHLLGYRCAQAILAPWPAVVGDFPGQREHRPRLVHTGGISRMASRSAAGRAGSGVGVVLGGRDDETMAVLATRLEREVPALDWVRAGGGTWVDDLESLLAGAAIVVTHAGQNAIADVAAISAPAVVVPTPRPHGEQEALAAAVDRLALARVVPHGQAARAPWRALVEAAQGSGDRWWMWRTGGAVDRAADLIEEVGRG